MTGRTEQANQRLDEMLGRVLACVDQAAGAIDQAREGSPEALRQMLLAARGAAVCVAGLLA
ncbi:hypothetical protein ALI144C_07505 [Actinosynnema sp. ALI-1.44]|uniref:hypothetical protein n=1 Tax=Actinosynnema sp. ALI-1.44 TaxID=1933779 RepID=UPI00097C7B0C|nr:hypothetical protein [Actinosynnema sp. ALI-1.44]ONI88275.1 hypothetical protein ALI144C_07505 [Actinosynnema sp. ALI-1.44]